MFLRNRLEAVKCSFGTGSIFLMNRLNVPYESVLINYCTIFSITLLASCKAAFMTLKINLAGQKVSSGICVLEIDGETKGVVQKSFFCN